MRVEVTVHHLPMVQCLQVRKLGSHAGLRGGIAGNQHVLRVKVSMHNLSVVQCLQHEAGGVVVGMTQQV
jgi:hypothetical protein